MTSANRLHVHQFVPALLPFDAVGNHTLETDRALRQLGIGAAIWAGTIHPMLSQSACLYQDFRRRRVPAGGRPVLLYQAASASEGLVDFLLRCREPKVISYHNLTPAHYFERYDSSIAAALRRATSEVRRLAVHVRIAVATSEFNAADLRRMGVEEVHVIPPYLGPGLCAEPDPSTLAALGSSRAGLDLVFVGRVVPNKGHEHLIRVLAAIRSAVDPRARLFVVGAPGIRLYMDALTRLAEKLAPGGVTFTGSVPDAGLAAFYRHCDVFLCMSEHEGFGIPLVEAMRQQLPIVAYDSSAIAETLGGAGVLIGTTDPMVVAELVGRIAADPDLRADLCRRQLRRAEQLESFPRDGKLIDVLCRAEC